MINRNRRVSNYHMQYMDVTKHWSEKSESYAGADALITALSDGWEFRPEVEYHDHNFGGNRSIRVYNIELAREGETVVMPVIHNPYLTRMLRREQLELVKTNGS